MKLVISCIFQLDLRKLDPQSAAQGQQGISTFLHSLGIQLRIQQADLAILTSEGLAVRMSHAMPCHAMPGQCHLRLCPKSVAPSCLQILTHHNAALLSSWSTGRLNWNFWHRMGNKHSDPQKPSSAKVNSAGINLAVCSVSLGWNCGLEGRTLQSLTIGHQGVILPSPGKKHLHTLLQFISPIFVKAPALMCISWYGAGTKTPESQLPSA